MFLKYSVFNYYEKKPLWYGSLTASLLRVGQLMWEGRSENTLDLKSSFWVCSSHRFTGRTKWTDHLWFSQKPRYLSSPWRPELWTLEETKTTCGRVSPSSCWPWQSTQLRLLWLEERRRLESTSWLSSTALPTCWPPWCRWSTWCTCPIGCLIVLGRFEKILKEVFGNKSPKFSW